MTVHETSDGRPLDSPRTVARRRKTETETERSTTSQPDHGTGAAARSVDREPTRTIPPIDALTAVACLLRPDWPPALVRATLARTSGSWRDLATRTLRVALDPDQRTPLGIENADMRRYESTPRHLTRAEWETAPRCDHGAIAGACALCRHTTPRREAS